MTRPRVREAERQLIAGLCGQAWAHARHGPLETSEEAGAVALLAGMADGRTDLLAAATGLMEGGAEERPSAEDHSEAWTRAARLCRLAGADPEVIPVWRAEGRRRARRNAAEEKRARARGEISD